MRSNFEKFAIDACESTVHGNAHRCSKLLLPKAFYVLTYILRILEMFVNTS